MNFKVRFSVPFHFTTQTMYFLHHSARPFILLIVFSLVQAVFAPRLQARPIPCGQQLQPEATSSPETGETDGASVQRSASASRSASAQRSARVIRVPLPITLSISQQIQRTLQIVSAEAPEAIKVDNRPVVMLEFESARVATGTTNSNLGACLNLAEFLTSPAMARLQTIAYISADPQSSNEIKGQLTGHAVLVAIACSEIVMEHDTVIGDAGTGEVPLPTYMAEMYKGIASKRYALPVEVVLSMLQGDRGLFRVTTPEEIVFTDQRQLEQLERQSRVSETTTLAPANRRALLTAEQLKTFRLINHRVKSKTELARKLNLASDQLKVDASANGTWKAITIKVPDFLDQRTARWIIRSIAPAITRYDANLVFLEMDNSVGALEAGVDLARAIAEFDPANIRTVAVIKQSARSGSAFAALACDQILVMQNATLGGFEPADAPGGDRPHSVSASYRASYCTDAKSIAAKKQRDWSMFAAVIDDEIEVARYRNAATDETRLLCNREWESLEDGQQWVLSGLLDTGDGINADPLKQMNIASSIIENQSDVKTIFQLDQSPRVLAPTASDRWIQSLAGFLTSPTIATFLIMGAFFFITTEMSAPGLGVPGFLGTLCLFGFFWAQYFDGNAQWFEILLFVIGITFILMEVFVIPGFGIFGIGGIIMVCVSIVLAAQAFLVPVNVRDVEKLPNSLFPLVGAGFGILIAVLVLPRYMHEIPFLKNVILAPPKKPTFEFDDLNDSQSTANLAHLIGQRGIAATKLMPSGRAKFGDLICDVLTEGHVVEKGAPVEVVEAVANRVVVKKA